MFPHKISGLRYFCVCYIAWYREPGSNRHAHHWAKDFKSFLSTYSNIAAVKLKSAAKVLLFFDICKKNLHISIFFYTFAPKLMQL